MNAQVEWWVINYPDYDGFIRGMWAHLIFTVCFTPSFKDTRHFQLHIMAGGTTAEISYHDTPQDAMNSAQSFVVLYINEKR